MQGGREALQGLHPRTGRPASPCALYSSSACPPPPLPRAFLHLLFPPCLQGISSSVSSPGHCFPLFDPLSGSASWLVLMPKLPPPNSPFQFILLFLSLGRWQHHMPESLPLQLQGNFLLRSPTRLLRTKCRFLMPLPALTSPPCVSAPCQVCTRCPHVVRWPDQHPRTNPTMSAQMEVNQMLVPCCCALFRLTLMCPPSSSSSNPLRCACPVREKSGTARPHRAYLLSMFRNGFFCKWGRVHLFPFCELRLIEAFCIFSL